MIKLNSFQSIIRKKFFTNLFIGNKIRIILCAGIVFFLTLILDIFATLHIGGLDDAYITYTFAKNLANGDGIVWSVGGAPVYGSTTFTYTILLALFGYFGFSIPTVSILLGAFFWGLSNVILFLLIKDKLGFKPAFFAAMISAISLNALNLSFGMETGLYAFLVISAFFLYIKNKYFLTSIVAALLIMTRLDGILVPVIIISHFLIYSDLPQKKRTIFAKLILPAITILIPWAIFLYLYFGNVLPNSFLAKRLFGASVSGLFYPEFYWDIFQIKGVSISLILTVLFFSIIFIGVVNSVLNCRDKNNLIYIWLVAYVAMFTLERMPHSPWYYAPAIPLIYISYVSGATYIYRTAVDFKRSPNNHYETLAHLLKYLILIILIVHFILTAQASYRQIKADMFGEQVYNNEQRRVLGEVVLNDMKLRNITNTSLMAYEVGYLGYNIPGEVYDILGLVSPDVVKQGGIKNPLYILEKYKPEYSVIVDIYAYPPTAPIYQSFEFQSNYKELFSLPTAFFGINYKVFRREPFQIQNIWNFDLKKSPVTVHQIKIINNTNVLILESTGYDPYLIYDNLKTQEFTNGILCINVNSPNSDILEILLDFGRNFDYENSIKFMLTGHSQTLCSKIPNNQSISGVRIDPLSQPGKITINNLSVWAPK